jgi:hypothetical protein
MTAMSRINPSRSRNPDHKNTKATSASCKLFIFISYGNLLNQNKEYNPAIKNTSIPAAAKSEVTSIFSV